MSQELFHKFIVIVNIETKEKSIYFGRCVWHKELLKRIQDLNAGTYQCTGGGKYRFDVEENSISLYDNSGDFGHYDLNEVKEIIKSKRIFDNPQMTKNLIDQLHVMKYHIRNEEKFKFELLDLSAN